MPAQTQTQVEVVLGEEAETYGAAVVGETACIWRGRDVGASACVEKSWFAGKEERRWAHCFARGYLVSCKYLRTNCDGVFVELFVERGS